MTHKVLAFLVVLVLAAGTLLTSCGPAEPAGEPIKLGAVLPLVDITGDQAAKAMKLAEKEINAAGGVLGRPLEVIIVDDEMKGEKGAAALDKLATVDKVDVFIGGMSSGVHMAQIPILKKYEKVTVWIGAAASVVCEAPLEGCDWYFHLHPWDYLQVQSYIEGWQAITEKYPEVKVDSWFVAYEEGAFGSASFAGFEALWPEVGWTVDGESFKSSALGGGDYRTVLRHAQDMNPDVFIWVGYDADALPIVEQAKEVGFAPPLFIGSPPGWPADFGKSPLAAGVTLYGMWAPSISEVSGVSKHFWDAYIEEYGSGPATYFAPLGYTNVYFVVEGIEKAGTLERGSLIAALEETEYAAPVGETLTIEPSEVIKHQGFTKQKILQWQDGVQQVIWPFEFATAEPKYPFPAWDAR